MKSASNTFPGGGAGIALIIILALPLVFALWVRHLILTDTYVFINMMGETAFFERVQNRLLACAFGVAFYLVVRAARARRKMLAGLFACLALGTGIIAMEEINWGQRKLQLQTPAEWQRKNVQREMNLHNLKGVHENQSAVVLIICSYAILSGLSRISPRVRATTWAPYLTVTPAAITWFMIPAGYVLYRMIFGSASPEPAVTRLIVMLQEPAEVAFYGGFVVTTLGWLRAMTRDATSAR